MDSGPSILEYAGGHGLCTDYTQESPLLILTALEASHVNLSLYDEEQLPALHNSGVSVRDEWSITVASARLLKDILQPRHEQSPEYYHDYDLRRQLKLELPLLRNDAELDFAKWDHKLAALQPKDLRAIINELVPEDISNHSDFDWPLMDDGLFDRVQSRLSVEKMSVRPSVLEFLRNVLISTSEPDTDYGMEWKGPPERMPSPLLPLSPKLSIVPHDEQLLADNIPLTSSPVDPGALNLQLVHDAILFEPLDEQPGLSLYPLMVSPSSSPSESFGAGARPDEVKRKQPEDLKMELPLTPRTDFSSPFKKIKLDALLPSEALSSPTPMTSSDEQCYNMFFDDMIDLSAPAVHVLENEQLLAVESTTRMQLPVIADAYVAPPWDYARKHKTSSLSELVQALYIDAAEFTRTTWPHSGLHQLCWNPIPAVNLHNIGLDSWDLNDAETYLGQLNASDEVEQQVQSDRPRLGILDTGEDKDEELEPRPVHVSSDTGLEELALYHQRQQVDTPDALVESMTAHIFRGGAASTLDSFFSVHTGQALRHCPSTLSSGDLAQKPASREEGAVVTVPPSQERPPPPIADLLAPAHIMVSPSLLAERHLMSQLTLMLRRTTFLERPLLESDADIIPCPGIGIILTSLQSVKQRALPGKARKPNNIMARIAAAQPVYDMLLVLIAVGAHLDEGDIAAINGIATANVRVLLTPTSIGHRAHHIASTICSVEDKSRQMLGDDDQVEVIGEGLLRAAGVDGSSALLALKATGSIASLAALGRQDRYTLLGPVIGTKALSHITALLETPWDR